MLRTVTFGIIGFGDATRGGRRDRKNDMHDGSVVHKCPVSGRTQQQQQLFNLQIEPRSKYLPPRLTLNLNLSLMSNFVSTLISRSPKPKMKPELIHCPTCHYDLTSRQHEKGKCKGRKHDPECVVVSNRRIQWFGPFVNAHTSKWTYRCCGTVVSLS